MGHRIADDGALVEAGGPGGAWLIKEDLTGLTKGYSRHINLDQAYRQYTFDIATRGQTLVFPDSNAQMRGGYRYNVMKPNQPVGTNMNNFSPGSYTSIIGAADGEDVIGAHIVVNRLGAGSKYPWVAHLTASSASGTSALGTWWFTSSTGKLSVGSFSHQSGEASIYVKGYS